VHGCHHPAAIPSHDCHPGSDDCHAIISNRLNIADSLKKGGMESHHPKRMESVFLDDGVKFTFDWRCEQLPEILPQLMTAGS